MQGIDVQPTRWPQGRPYAGFVILAILLLTLAGCATGGRPEVEPVEKELSRPEEPLVTILDEGRKGFIIREIPRMEAGAARQFERATAMMKREEYGKAIELLEEIIEGSPGVTAPYINGAIASRHLEKLPQAEKYLKAALELLPGHPVASNEYGLLLRKTGRFAEARAVYEKSLAIFPDYYPARRNLGILCDLYLNDRACALEQYERYSEAMPGDEHVELWIADLRMRLGN